MGQALDELTTLLALEQLDNWLFVGQSEALGLRQVFGGQVIAQAIRAAQLTVPTDRIPHSLHGYFLRPADSQQPIFYETELLRDGKSLSARRINARQQGQDLFTMTASFQGIEQGFCHQQPMPACPSPETLAAEQALLSKLKASPINQQFVNVFGSERPLDVRPVQAYNPLQGTVTSGHRQMWIKANGVVPEESWLHYALLGYAADVNFLPVALQRHGKGFLEEDMQVATIDHSMWFHRPIDMNQWLLYDITSPSASNNRGFVRGSFYTRQGELVASTAQEGIIRQR